MISPGDLISLVYQELINTKHLIDELTSDFQSSEAQGKLGEILSNIVDILFKSFEKDVKKIRNDRDYFNRIYRLCSHYLQKIREIHKKYIRHLHRYNNASFPFELARLLKKYISEKLPDCEVLIEPYSGYKYGVELLSIRNITEDLFISSKYNNKFAILTYPEPHGRNALSHAFLFHSIGHLIDFQEEITENLLNEFSFNKFSVDKALNIKKSRSVFINKCVTVLKEWLSEIVSDLMAIKFIGPAFFFSFFYLSITSNSMEKIADNYLCPALRFSYLMDELEHLGYFKRKIFRPHLEEIRSFLSNTKNHIQKKMEKTPEYKIVINAIENGLKKRIIQNKVENAIKNLSLNNEEMLNYMIDELILKGIPPTEIKNESIASPEMIINSGWLTFLSKKKELFKLTSAKNNEEKAISLSILNELLLKAIESSEILNSWRKL